MNYLDQDEWGLWLWTPAGSTAQRGDEPRQIFNHANVKLVSPGDWWTAIWNDGRRYDLYIDIITPAAISPDIVTMVDIDLDLVRRADGEVTIEDEEEFADHQRRYGYPAYVIERAWQTTAALKQRLERREEPFGEVGDAMVTRAQAMANNMRT